ncbi:hypothetical protein NC652_013584 [Populus alba x Populus x berolinensis]|nr:hypothetical protein NC652_013584 [Populus alba x Populus x berolinensis]
MHTLFILCMYYLPSRLQWLWIFVVYAFAEYPIRASTGISFHFRCKILWFSLVDANCFGDWIFMFPTLKPSLCK